MKILRSCVVISFCPAGVWVGTMLVPSTIWREVFLIGGRQALQKPMARQEIQFQEIYEPSFKTKFHVT